MKGISIIRDETRNKRFVQIDLERLEQDQESVEDLLMPLLPKAEKVMKP